MTVDGLGVEIEIKLEVKDPSAFISRLGSLPFVCQVPRTHEYNILFDTEDRQLSDGNRLLRLRRWGEDTVLTVKAPVAESEAREGYKMRRELEIHVDDFEKTRTVFQLLGYRVFFRYEKYRSQYCSPEGLKLTLDETPIGFYAELEGSMTLIDRYIELLGYSKADAVCQNYRSLFLQSGHRGDMLFD